MSAVNLDRAKFGIEVTLRFRNGHTVTGQLEGRDATAVRIGDGWWQRSWIVEATHARRS